MYVKWSQDQYTRDNVSKREREEKIQKSLLHPSLYTPFISYTKPPPMSMTTLISKLLPIFVTSDKGQVNQVDILSSLAEPSSSLASSALPEPSSLSSSDASGEGEEAITKPPITAYRNMIRLTQVFT